MINVGILEAVLRLRDEMSPQLQDAASKMQQTGQRLRSVGAGLTVGVTLPMAAVGAAAIKMASDAEEAANKFDVVMGPAADRVRAELEKLTETIPLTRSQMEGMAAGVQDMLVPMGVARAEAANMSLQMVGLAGDLGSFNNVGTDQVLMAMQSALAGSSEPMRRFGVDTREAALKAIALEAGLIGAGQEMNQTARAQAVLLAIQKDSTDAMGDAARTADSTANLMRFLGSDVRALGQSLGQTLIPAVRPLLIQLKEWVNWLKQLDPQTQKWIVLLAGAAAVAGPLLIAMGALVAAASAVTGAYGRMTLALAANTAAHAANSAAVMVSASRLGPLVHLLPSIMTKTLQGRNAMGQFTKGVTKFNAAFLTAPGRTKRFGIALGQMGKSIAKIIPLLGRGLFMALQTGLKFLTGPAGWIVGIGLLLAKFEPFRNFVVALGRAMLALAQEGIAWVAKGFRELLEWIQPATDKIKAFAEFVGKGFNYLTDPINEFTHSISASMAAQAANRENAEQLATAIERVTKVNEPLITQLRTELKDAYEKGGTIPMGLYQKAVDAFGGSAEFAQEVIGQLITEIVEAGKAGSDAAGGVDTLTDSVAQLARSLGVETLRAEMGELNSAIALVDESGDRLSKQGLAQILDKMKRLREEGVQLEGRLAQISQKSREFGTSALKNLPPAIAPTIDWEEALKGVDEELGNVGNSMPALENYPQSVGGIVTSTIDWGEVQSNVNDFLSETRGLMSLLGVESDSVVGRIIAGFSKVFDMFNSLTGIVDKVLGSFGSGGGGGDGGFLGLGNLLGGLFGGGGKGLIPGIPSGGIPGMTQGLTSAGSTAGAGFLGGFGSTISGGLSSLAGTLAPLFTNPFTAIIGGGIAGFFAIKSFLKKANIEETVQRELGVGLSEGTKAALEDLAEQRGGDLSSTAQLAIGQIFREAAVRGDIIPADILAEEVGDLFSFLERGEINTEELGKALDDVVPMLIDRLDELGPAGVEQIQRIVSAAQAAGVEFEGLTELALRFGIEIDATAEQVSAAFSEMGGNVSTLTEFMEKSATRTERAWGRVQRILGKIARGEELGETQTRFAGRVGLPVPSFAEGAFVPRPTLAVVGDAPFGEDVIPRRAPGVPGTQGGGSGADGGITINISIKAGAVIESRRELARTIVNTVKEGVERARNTRGLRRAIKKVSE